MDKGTITGYVYVTPQIKTVEVNLKNSIIITSAIDTGWGGAMNSWGIPSNNSFYYHEK